MAVLENGSSARMTWTNGRIIVIRVATEWGTQVYPQILSILSKAWQTQQNPADDTWTIQPRSWKPLGLDLRHQFEVSEGVGRRIIGFS